MLNYHTKNLKSISIEQANILGLDIDVLELMGYPIQKQYLFINFCVNVYHTFNFKCNLEVIFTTGSQLCMQKNICPSAKFGFTL